MNSKLQSDGYYHCHWWWRRLMNAYEVKAGMACLQCKTVWSISERFKASFSRWGAIQIYNLYLSLPFLRFDCQFLNIVMTALHDTRKCYFHPRMILSMYQVGR